ncbi:MAG: hypothetical protein ACM3QS_02135 [Bacteroidota bacterium]
MNEPIGTPPDANLPVEPARKSNQGMIIGIVAVVVVCCCAVAAILVTYYWLGDAILRWLGLQP